MEDSVFRFKNFEVSHGKSSMKVGVDAVLLGTWAGEKARNILDVGTGCGVISLILAQRFPNALINAIDIDRLSVEEARYNFNKSPWNKRLKVWNAEYPKDILMSGERYDLIVSNPPYFNSGITTPFTRREKARHQDTLSVFSLLENSMEIITDTGKLAIIFPLEFEDSVINAGYVNGLNVQRLCRVKDHEGKMGKRIMMEFMKENPLTVIEEDLTLFNDKIPTEAYKNLCKDFYLKF